MKGMTALALPQSGGLFSRLFGQPPHPATDDTRSAARRAFDRRYGAEMDAICDFLAEASLAPHPDHLLLAKAAVYGDAHGQELIAAARDGAGHISPLAVSSLLVALGERQDGRAMERMIGEAEAGVGHAHVLAGASSAAIADYQSAIGIPIRALASPGTAKQAACEVQSLTRNLLDRTRQAEEALRSSAEMMGELRERLAETQRQAFTDPLTDLPNRRAFDRALTEAMDAAGASGSPLSIAFCDIDRFKSVNDTHGHSTGDRVLRHVAELLAQLSDQGAHVARHGGEEFALIFTGHNASEAFAKLDQARLLLNEEQLCGRDSGLAIGQLSFSAGIAQVHPGEGAGQLLGRADAALYAAKEAGRNRIRVAPPPDLPRNHSPGAAAA